MKHTDEQKQIIETSLRTKSLVVNALAGSGKTSTAIDCVVENQRRYPRERIIYLSFNKSVAQTMKAKLAAKGVRGPTITTLHSLAWRYKAAPFLETGRSIDSLKPHDIEECTDKMFRHSIECGGRIVDDPFVLRRCRRLLLDRMEAWCRSSDVTLQEFCDRPWSMEYEASIAGYGLDGESMDHALGHLWTTILEDDSMKFPHGVYLKLFQLDMPKLGYDLAIVDEAQDLAPVNEAIVKSMSREGTRLIFFGDRYQQIYTWNGSVNAIQRFEPDSEVLSLTQSFRCPADVVREAERYLKLLGFNGNFRPAPAPCVLKHKSPIVISRTNASLLANLSGSGLRSRDIHLVGGIRSYNFDPISDFINFTSGQKEMIKSPVIASFVTDADYEEYAEATNDVEMKNARTIVRSLGVSKVINILDAARKGDFATSPDEAEVCLSTGHKCKGSEFEIVQIDESFTNIMESFAESRNRTSGDARTPSEKVRASIIHRVPNAMDNAMVYSAEELRLAYVSLTRSTDGLFPGPLHLDGADAAAIASHVDSGDIILADIDENGNMAPVDTRPAYTRQGPRM